MELQLDITPEQLEEGRMLFARGTTFVKGVVNLEGLPDDSVIAEVAFAGRSNVGKSSLINALTNMTHLARTSNTPGSTRELNYFDVNGRMHLVDMPGYGYARASKGEIKRWNLLIKQYLKGRTNLRRVYILIDSRHGIKPSDIELMEMLDEAAVTYAPVLTKLDKIKKSDVVKVHASVFEKTGKRAAAFPFLVDTSAEKKTGIDILRGCIWNAIQG